MLIEQIENLDDPAAVRLLRRVAKEKAAAGAVETEVSPELAGALAVEFGVEPAETDATPGELARATLLLLAQDPAEETMLMDRMIGDDDRQILGVDPITATAAVTAALVVLQTHVRIERDKEGKWSFLLEKKAASDGLLKAVAGKLAGLMGGK
jgi:hypothetical protein